MFFAHVILNNAIIERAFFANRHEAMGFAKEKSQEKVWHLGNNSMYFGDVYNPVKVESIDYIDAPIKIFM